MPGLLQNGRKRPAIALSEDEEGEQSDYPSSVSVGSKRARHDARDASESRNQPNGHGRHNQRRTQNGDASDALLEDVFQPGTLVRVKLRNFVTYTAAEFHLGPSLNMVIGPNGTGKSTLVCAICLGLGWASEHLGRAKELGQFVKNGSDEAEIEIELAAGPGMATNPIVRRIIRKADNKSIFWINGKHASKNAVLSLCKEFSIQIDNLCQFLPQDRVVEFAKMSDVDRLKETQRAAAPKHMVEWHDQLKELRAQEKVLETKQQNEQTHLDGLQRRQNQEQADVDRYHQREGLEQKAKCLERVKPIIELAQRKNDLNQAKKDLQLARRELDQINADVEPVRQAQAEVEGYKDQIGTVVKIRQNRVDMIKTQADKILAKISKDKQAVTDFATRVKNEVTSKKERERDVARIQAEIQRLERQREDRPVDYDFESYNTRRSDLRSRNQAVDRRYLDCEDAYKAFRARGHTLKEENHAASEQRARLDTQSGKQASVLQKLSPHTATAWKWFQENKDKLALKGTVHGPPILECVIKDPRYADAVESQLRKGDLIAITCTHADDQKLLSDAFLGKNGLHLHDIYTRTSPKPLAEHRPPMAPSELHSMGFEGFLIDYIKGPDSVLAMLCDNARLGRTAYAPTPITDEQHAAVSSSAIQKWVSGRDVYQITTRREYGASSTTVTQLRAARYFVDQPANLEEKQQLDETIARIQQDAAELKEEITNCKREMGDLKEQLQQLRQERDETQAEEDRVKKALAEWRALPDKIQRKQEEVDGKKAEIADTSNRIRAIKTNAQEASLSAALLTIDYAKAVTQLRTFHESLLEAEIRLIEARSEFNALQNENRDILQKQQRKEAEIQDLNRRNNALRLEYQQIRESTQASLDDLTTEEKEMVMEYKELASLEALEQEVQAVAARLELMAGGNPAILKAFEKRKDDIAKTEEKLGELTANLESAKESIVEIREQWEPQLDALIAKISAAFAHNFEQIGCAGEVTVYKDEEDFDRWSVQISVRFREGETLSVLNSHRQSGGERAVSTIFYLMALQDLAQSPFRVVDEINQGMDPRNERMVHERMVDIACQERTSQYFLITPKLLTGLKFHPKMKVHVINSGEHVPDAKEAKGWNMRDFAKVALRTRKGIEVA
ncbi:P-loop containing nucleoside triphosphate hydrolase protein [Ophiobolus disseminans]|uniref:Structural maintenance of chromosomes protein 5 n=1 Tax=Ophiobolus disseminans TaxID=1469910 RepID=A0A6A7A9B0_9PLEO|nr:P-loop containing nucleoside triphosphate hydrolase protein [Ophiobolus disseminans]